MADQFAQKTFAGVGSPAEREPRRRSYFAKRLFDITLSAMALLILALPLLIVMAILRCTGEGQIWYLQERMGYRGRRFMVFKFATMLKGSEMTGTGDITLRNDPRVLRVGRLLRKAKINELPQLINILKGDMSFVGWRPLTPRPFLCYSDDVQKLIVRTKPGLTGVGSIVFRDEEGIISRSGKPPEDAYREDIAPYKAALELWYQQHQSFWLDLKLILLTAWAVVRSDGRLYEKWLLYLPPRPQVLS